MLVLAVGPALPPVDVPEIKVPPAHVPKVQLPPVAKPPVQLPPVQVPDLPKVQLPPVAKPPVAKPPVATPTAPPVATPAPTAPATKPAAVTTGTTSPKPDTTAAPATDRPKRQSARARDRRAPSQGERAVTRRPQGTTRFVAATAPTAAARSTATPHPDAPDTATPPGLAGDVIDLVEALPAAILWSILGIAAVALALAGRAYGLGRQRTALVEQRGILLDDIGLLSQALLPPVPELDGLAVSAAYRPADGPAAGGDFYDVFALDDHRVGVLLGDVSGHGRDSVTLAALARYTLRTLLAAGHRPGAALAEADRLLEREMRPRFATVIAAVYDRRTTRLTYAKAGHAPPIVVGAPHDPDAETPACPIGVGVGSEWPEYHVDLADGVSVCLVTDGFEEARRDGARLGRAEVERLVAAHERPDAACLLDDLGTLADQVCDDTAAVVVARA
ncbi:MAG TPA: PP2C family protein-serine/threonine phosphatase [Solirubrobacteraceae bacterium]|nr:PP2C family protein-serine/threonine phosphatase [Solirubrobacteraceae bacterium]